MPWSGRGYLEALASAGATVGVYNPMHRKIIDQLMHPTSSRLVASDHSKIFATERFAITGGRNVASDYFSSPDDRKGVYYDADVLVEGGTAAKHLKAAMHAEAGNSDVVERVTPGLFSNPLPHYAELLGSAAMMDAWLARALFTDSQKKRLRASDEARSVYVPALVKAA